MSDSRVAKAKIEDETLLSALDDAEEEYGSMAEALRHAVSTAYVEERDAKAAADRDGVPAKARDAHRKLVEWAGIGGRLELDTAESVLANHLNIQKQAVRKTVIYPLKAADAVHIHQGIHTVSVIVGSLDGDDVEVRDETAPAAETATDGGEARDRLDELADAVQGGDA